MWYHIVLYFPFIFAIVANDLWSQISAILATFFATVRHEKVLYTRNFVMGPLSDAISVFATAIMLYTPDPWRAHASLSNCIVVVKDCTKGSVHQGKQ